MIYRILRRKLPHRAALALTVCWFLILIAAIAYCSFEPPADFHYGRY